MSCCDHHGNCRQGRDCPLRKQQDQHDQIMSWLDAALVLLIAVSLAWLVSSFWSLLS